MKLVDFTNGPIKITDKYIQNANELLKYIANENVEAKNEFWATDLTNENALDIKIYAQYDATMMANTITDIFSMFNFKFVYDASSGSLAIDTGEEYFITPELVKKILTSIEANYQVEIINVKLHLATRDRNCIKYEIKILECLEKLVGFVKAMNCFEMMPDMNSKSILQIEESDDEEVKNTLNLYQGNIMKTRTFIIKRMKNYNQYLKALLALENAKDELDYRSQYTINLEEYKNNILECEKEITRLKNEYDEIDNEDKLFGRDVVAALHPEKMPKSDNANIDN